MSIARLCACTVMGSSDCIGARQLLIQISTTHIKSSRHAVFMRFLRCRGMPRAHVVCFVQAVHIYCPSTVGCLQQMVWQLQLMAADGLMAQDLGSSPPAPKPSRSSCWLEAQWISSNRKALHGPLSDPWSDPLSQARAGVGFGISGIFLSVDIACELLPKEPL